MLIFKIYIYKMENIPKEFRKKEKGKILEIEKKFKTK